MTPRSSGRLVLVTAALVLAGCAGLGGPGGPAGPGGTQAPYSVGGRRYVPLADWRGFVEEGVASWYGAEHHGRFTASGERFDADALTAAHPVLPMQTCVRVETAGTGRIVVVRVNDRGPFIAGRIIDVSRAAARLLGLLGPGTAPVRLTAVGLAGDGRCRPEAPVSGQVAPPGRPGS